MVALRGVANPGNTLRLEGAAEPATCQVRTDGSWAMPEVRLTPGTHTLTVADVDHPARSGRVEFTVAAVRPISIISPGAGETLEARRIEVTGKASPGRLVCLRLGRGTRTERADDRGSFRFKDLELTRWGEQRLEFYYAEDPTQGSTRVVVQWPGLDLPSIVDPVTRSHLEPGADIVQCAACYTYCYRATWRRLTSCPRCGEESGFWDRPSPRFHTPRAVLRTT